jgi:tetratricopeptide (TPR) repeat protein
VLHTLNYRRVACIGYLTCLIAVEPATYLLAESPQLRILSPSHVVWASEAHEASGERDNTPAPAADSAVTRTSYTGDPVAGSVGRTSLETITPQAQAHITYALNLAERGAIHSAQSEFIMALDLIADALDADTRDLTRSHARAVKAGLKAIEETKDFVPADTANDIGINVLQIAAAHQTPVLKNADGARLSRAEALQRYHTFATQQLAYAGGNSPIGSAALYGLGRAQSVATAGAGIRNPLAGPNAIALYQAALIVDPKNYMACNELGVLMARYGELDAAENQFMHSLSIKPQPETWHNLATVYRAMGQSEKTLLAEQEKEKLVSAARAGNGTPENGSELGSRPMLDFVDPNTFAASGTPYGLDGPPINTTNAPQQQSFGKRLVAKLIPWPKGNKPEQAEIPRFSQRIDSSHGGETDGRLLPK